MAIEVLLFVNEEERVVSARGETLREAFLEAQRAVGFADEMEVSPSDEDLWGMICNASRMRSPIPGRLIQGLVPCDGVSPTLEGADVMLVVDADRLWWVSGIARRV